MMSLISMLVADGSMGFNGIYGGSMGFNGIYGGSMGLNGIYPLVIWDYYGFIWFNRDDNGIILGY